MKKIIIGVAAAVVVLAIIGSVLVFGNFFKPDPKTAVTEAVTNTLTEFLPVDGNGFDTYQEFWVANQFKADVTLGINELSGDAFASVDPSILAALKMFTFNETMRYNFEEKKREDRLSLQLAVTELAEIITYADENQAALSVPVAFDYFITADPAHFSTDWNNSLLGTMLGTLIDGEMEQTIYDTYIGVWLPEKNDAFGYKFDYDAYLQILSENAEYLYIGEETLSDGEWEMVCDSYDVTIPPESYKALLKKFVEDLKELNALSNSQVDVEQIESYFETFDFDGQILRISVADKKLRGIWLYGDIYTEIFFKGEEVNFEEIHAETMTDSGDLRLDVITDLNGTFSSECEFTFEPIDLGSPDVNIFWNFMYDEDEPEDNLEFSLSVDTGADRAEMSGNGTFTLTEEFYDLQLDSLAVTSNLPGAEMDVDVSLGVTVTEDTEPIELTGETKALTDITEMDLMAMYEKIMSNEEFGALLQQFQ